MKPLQIKVEPSLKHPDILNILHAMDHARDFFDLLTDDANSNIVWNLKSASRHSPFEITGVPVDLRTHAMAYSTVENHVRVIERAFANIVKGDPLDSDFPANKRTSVERFLERHTNGIGRTECHFGGDNPVFEIMPQIAERFLMIIRREPDALYDYLFSTFARREVGSIEGRIVDIGTHYEKPAVHVKEHSTNKDIWCQVDELELARIERKITAGDVWKHRRVKVRGDLSYDSQGQLVRVYEGRIDYIDTKDVDIEDLHDEDFTEGLPVHEYLEKLRESDFE